MPVDSGVKYGGNRGMFIVLSLAGPGKVLINDWHVRADRGNRL